MTWLVGFWRSTVGAKVVMAVTGVVLLGFTIVHMAGNLQVFWVPEFMNEYSKLLHSMPELLWPIRAALLGSVFLHIGAWVMLRRRSSAARPIAYRKKQNRAATIYSRTMMLTGPIVLIFIVIHLMNLTVGNLHPDFREQANGIAPEAYHNLTTLLANPVWAIFYIIANLSLGSHLWHGTFAMSRTLGLSGERQIDLARLLASAITLAVVGGNVLVATACMLGLTGFFN